MRTKAFRVLASALIVLSATFAGCLGGDEDIAPAATDEPAAPTAYEVGANATAGLGGVETNQTVSGSGGRPHIHDYWLDRTEVTLFDAPVRWDIYPFFVDRDPVSGGLWQARWDLPNGTLVYEGTGKLIVTMAEPTPAAISLNFQYVTALSRDWSPPVAMTPGVPVEIDVTPKTADSPHAYRTAWSFRFTSSSPGKTVPPTTEIPVTIVAVKAKSVEFWPGHPDFYAKGPSRIVLDTDAKTVYSSTDAVLNADWGTRIPAEYLVSMGTTRLEIFVNVTGYSGTPGTTNGDVFLYYRHANLSSDNTFDSSAREVFADEKTGHFNVTGISHTMHDPPYAEQSRWTFRLMAAVRGAVDTCGDCTPYELSYNIRVVAWNDDWAPPAPAASETPR